MVHRLSFRAMGTEMLVCVDNGSDEPPVELADIPGWFEEWEQTLSRFRFNSELSLLNRADGQPVAVSETLWQVFQSALAAEKFTDGLVTPAIAKAMLEVGYDRDFQLMTGQTLVPILFEHAPIPALNLISWDEATRCIYLPENMQLDFGGIAKGWAAGQVVQRLGHLGSVLMNCGGDSALNGPLLDGSPWEVGVFKPFDRSSGYLGMLYLQHGCGVATSSTDRRRWMQNDQLRHHIIDPESGLPASTDVISATVVAPTAIEAEAAAKSVLIRGSIEGLQWLESHPDLAALLILQDGQILYSDRIHEYLQGVRDVDKPIRTS
jgi:thiamine biosynthesis lipoprotein